MPEIKKEIQSASVIFTKPEIITEEEVSVSKEKKICLVCKIKISSHTFVCRNCGSFYCEKYYSALVDLENVCWAGDSAFEESNPVKLLKKREE